MISPPPYDRPPARERHPPIVRGPRRASPSFRRKSSETYKSRGEKLIANFLGEAGIKFHYEYPLLITDEDQKIRLWYPDFWLPEINIVVEYFGMVNEDAQYRELVAKKTKMYNSLDIDFIGLDKNMVQMHKNWEKYIVMRIMEIMDSKEPIYRRLKNLKSKYTWA